MLQISLPLGLLLLAGPPATTEAVAPDVSSLPVEVKLAEPVHALVLPMHGPYGQHEAAFSRLFDWMNERGIQPTGAAFGRYFGGSTTDPLWHVGFPIADGIPPTAPFETVDVPSRLVASLVVQGPYAQTSLHWPLLIAWAVSHGYRIAGEPMQIYSGDPEAAGSLGPTTELRLPIAIAR
jgi:effector-binding domain-containing protein